MRCDAWRGCLGLEPTPELYVEHLVEVFRAVRRVLKPSGSLWLNLGDCYDAGTSAARIASRTAEHGYWTNPAINLRPKAGQVAKTPVGRGGHAAVDARRREQAEHLADVAVVDGDRAIGERGRKA